MRPWCQIHARYNCSCANGAPAPVPAPAPAPARTDAEHAARIRQLISDLGYAVEDAREDGLEAELRIKGGDVVGADIRRAL